jgi:hypothetical protein
LSLSSHNSRYGMLRRSRYAMDCFSSTLLTLCFSLRFIYHFSDVLARLSAHVGHTAPLFLHLVAMGGLKSVCQTF